jgi:Astacin (Peptidase family M12A)
VRNRIHLPALLAATLLAAACSDGRTAVTPSEARQPSRPEGFAGYAAPQRGWVLGPNGAPMEITFEVRNGRAIWQGDIDLGPAESIPASPAGASRGGLTPRLGVIRDGSKARWPNAVVPYVIDANLPQPSRVTGAMSHIENNTGRVTFVPRTNQRDYVRFVRSNGCASSVGKVGGAQLVYLADGCSTGNTIHEISHALGMWHEQSRCDRDTYVRIVWENVASGYEHNFDKECASASDVFSYDEGSIMHYGPTAFSVNGLPTIVSLRGLDRLMGQRSGLSGTDANTINYMYP